jgi:hypothetical protein
MNFRHRYFKTEKGFLAEGNFNESERSIIKSVTQKSVLHKTFASKKKIGGEDIFNDNIIIEKLKSINCRLIEEHNIIDFDVFNFCNAIEELKNIYELAYYNHVTDKMFVLDIFQINRVCQYSKVLGKDYFISKLTQSSIDCLMREASTYEPNYAFNLRFYKSLNENSYWESWLRTPYAYDISTDTVNTIYYGLFGDLYNLRFGRRSVVDFNCGVRPAFYINLTQAMFKTGDGTKTSPYIL